MGESADQLILEYLAVVADIAHRHLGSHERVDFMTRLRARIEEHRRGSGDPAEVRRVLARFGDPERLVLRERRRLDGVGGEGAGPAGSAAQVPGSGGPRRERPPTPARGRGRTIRTFAWDPAGAAEARRAAQARRARRSASAPGPGDEASADAVAGKKGAGGLGALARNRPLEAGALGLLGLGGLLLPIPLWLFGAGLVGYSRMWTARAKLIGLAGPLVVTGLGALWYAVDGGDGVGIVDAIRTVGPTILRVAGLAGAIFLGVPLLRGAGVRSWRVRRRWYEP